MRAAVILSLGRGGGRPTGLSMTQPCVDVAVSRVRFTEEAIAPWRAGSQTIAPTQRDHHIQAINERGRMARQRNSGCNVRARVEARSGTGSAPAATSLRFHTDEAQAAQVAIAVEVLNHMLDLGRPNSVRVA